MSVSLRVQLFPGCGSPVSLARSVYPPPQQRSSLRWSSSADRGDSDRIA
jgi:hypothetical protein